MKTFDSGARSSEEAPRIDLPTYRHARLLGFGHKARQGKDLAVKLLVEAFPGRVARVAFADALRVVCRVQHGMTVKDAPLLQRVGVSAREADPLIWIRAAAWAIAELDAEANAPFLVCLPDTRFRNEADFVSERGETCRLVRLCADGSRFVATDRPADHPSEIDLDGYDWRHTVTARNVVELRRGVLAIGAAMLGAPKMSADVRDSGTSNVHDAVSVTDRGSWTYDEKRAELHTCRCGRKVHSDTACDNAGKCLAGLHPHAKAERWEGQ